LACGASRDLLESTLRFDDAEAFLLDFSDAFGGTGTRFGWSWFQHASAADPVGWAR
jgi:hypothetical protein